MNEFVSLKEIIYSNDQQEIFDKISFDNKDIELTVLKDDDEDDDDDNDHDDEDGENEDEDDDKIRWWSLKMEINLIFYIVQCLIFLYLN